MSNATGVTVLAVRRADGVVAVNMGPPQLDWREIPLARAADTGALPLPGAPAAVGMGNPHCITFVEDVALLTRECAIITRPGAPSRRRETEPIRPVLTERRWAELWPRIQQELNPSCTG